MKAVIITGGQMPSSDIVREEVKDAEYIICADRGAEVAYKYGIEPNEIIGDFDSIDKSILQSFKDKNIPIIKFPAEKDDTDTTIAIGEVLKRKVDELVILGATGSRIDHVLGNIGLLIKCLKQKVKCYIRDDNNIILLTDKNITLNYRGYKYFSLLSYGETVNGLTIEGGKYPLNNYELQLGDSLAVSNEFLLGKSVEINFKSGLLLIVESRD
ncbi:thiamine diphosphokinase [Clostridium peptidivorans]|uniref:thiamine diphosphokinase n=1 Tax=Clostridium peptidivorans TaxID=100174 RepID=UPI000BE489B5|nr:thiamine diphosphokinase [Clostridium peptidivorans]